MELILALINTFEYFLCVLSIGDLFLDYKCLKLKHARKYFLVIVCGTSIALLYSNTLLKILIHVVSVVAIGMLWFKENWKNILGLYFGSAAVLAMWSKLFDVIIIELFKFFNIAVTNNNVLEDISLFLILLCIRILGKNMKDKYGNRVRNIGARYWILFIITMFFDASIIILLGSFIMDTLQVERRNIVVIFYMCVVIGLLIQLVLLINTLVTRNVHKENEMLAKQFLESQNEHYQYLEKREYETKKFRHDIKNHLLLVENLIATEKYDEAECYLNTINEKVLSFSNQISVNNGIAEAILNRFYAEAKEDGVTLKVKGHFPMGCYISAYDICTILSNLLSNAIRAAKEAGGNEVLMNIKYTEKIGMTKE